MNTKTQKTIQTFCKVARIFCIIFFVMNIIAVISCALCEVFFLTGVLNTLFENGIVFFSDDAATLSLQQIYSTMDIALFSSASSIAIFKMAELYFRQELNEGTPFTFTGAKKLLQLGICIIVIPIVASLFATVVHEIKMELFQNVAESSISMDGNIIAGLIVIALSFVCKYGAEIFASQKEAEETSREEGEVE